MKIPRTLTNLSALSSNLTTLRIPPLSSNVNLLTDLDVNRTTHNEDPDGFISCQEYYGEEIDYVDLHRALFRLPMGREEIIYHVDSLHEEHSLPLIAEHGSTWIRIEMGGPQLPSSILLAPQTIRDIADKLAIKCAISETAGSTSGGVATFGTRGLNSFLSNPWSDIGARWPEQTAFLSVIIGNKDVPMSAIDYEPEMAKYCFYMSSLSALRSATGSWEFEQFAMRALRFYNMRDLMIGRSVPFWSSPYGIQKPAAEPLHNQTAHQNDTVASS